MELTARRRRMLALVMLAALLPSLLYLGHWSVRLPVPGTSAFLAIGMQAEHEAQASEGGHEEHCHGSATCTESRPAPAGMSFGLLNEGLYLMGAGGALVLVFLSAWRPGRVQATRPLLPPPRFA